MPSDQKTKSPKSASFGKRAGSAGLSQGNAKRPARVSFAQASTGGANAKSGARSDKPSSRASKSRGRIVRAPAAEVPEAVAAVKEADASAIPSEAVVQAPKKMRDRPAAYVCTFLVMTFLCIIGVWQGNRMFAPEMYHSSGPLAFAKAFEQGKNFATFDLNINIREMRNEQISRFKKAPEVVVLGASHWQEAHVELLPKMDFYNAHVHRDYYEDMPAVVEMFVRHDKLPRKMIIAIRDRLFTPVADRTDFLWLPGIPYYQAMAKRLGIEPHAYWETAPVQRWREQMSVRMLYSNALRWYKAPVKPHATSKEFFETLDVLLPGGSIHWSGKHAKLFTAERSERLAKEFAAENFASPPKIDPKGVATLDRLLAYLKEKKVEVAFVHPPFNPIYYDRVKNGAYRTGLARIEKITQDFAKKYDFKVFGSFDPAKVGCTAAMYIDAEHSNPECLGKVLSQYAALNAAGAVKEEPATPKPSISVSTDFERELPVAAIGSLVGSDVTTSDALAFVSRDDVAPVAAKRPAGEGRLVAAAQPIVPLPVQRPSITPPLPVRNPFLAATANCFPHGPLKHSELLAPSHDRRLPNRQFTKTAYRNVERPQ